MAQFYYQKKTTTQDNEENHFIEKWQVQLQQPADGVKAFPRSGFVDFFLLIHVDPLVKSLSTKYFPATRLVGTFSFHHQIMRFYLV